MKEVHITEFLFAYLGQCGEGGDRILGRISRDPDVVNLYPQCPEELYELILKYKAKLFFWQGQDPNALEIDDLELAQEFINANVETNTHHLEEQKRIRTALKLLGYTFRGE